MTQLDAGVVCFVVKEVFYCIACFFVVVVVVAVQVYAQGFKTGEWLLPFGAEFVAFVAQVYPRFAVVGMGVCIIVVVKAAAQARIVVIDVFFGQQVRIKLQIAFVNQALLPDDVGVAVVVEMAVGRQAVAVATVAVRHADKTFFAYPRQPDSACFGIGMAVGQSFQTAFFFLIARYGVIARFAVQAFGMQHEVVA